FSQPVFSCQQNFWSSGTSDCAAAGMAGSAAIRTGISLTCMAGLLVCRERSNPPRRAFARRAVVEASGQHAIVAQGPATAPEAAASQAPRKLHTIAEKRRVAIWTAFLIKTSRARRHRRHAAAADLLWPGPG